MTVAGTRGRGRRAVSRSPARWSWRLVEAELMGVSGFYEQLSVLICGVVHLFRLLDSGNGWSSPPVLNLSLASGARD